MVGRFAIGKLNEISQDGFAQSSETGRTEVMIRDQGEVLPCPWHQKVLGHLDQGNGLEQIFFGENFAPLEPSA